MLPTLSPMLAIPGIPTDSLHRYVAEPKLDGWRVMVSVEHGAITVRTRRGRNITQHVPELAPLATLASPVVLDGELVADAGRAGDFYRVGPAVAAHRRGSLAFVVFDLLWADGRSLTDETYEQRRARLLNLNLAGPVTVVPNWSGLTAPSLFAACEEHGIEGIMLKRRSSPYRPGERSEDWRKLKTRHWFEQHAAHRRPPEPS